MMGSNAVSAVLIAALAATAWLPAAPPEEPQVTVGWQKQLFLDDRVIDSTKHISRVLKEPQRWPGNPLIVGDMPWETWTVYLNGRGVLYDDDERQFKMWYLSPTFDGSAPSGLRYKVCYAFSDNGVQWTKPDLGLVDWEGSRSNNILPWGWHWMRRPNVIRDPRDPDPQHRFKMLYTDVIGDWPRTGYRELAGITKATSPDGIHWRHNVDGRPWRPGGNGTNVLGWDPAAGKYVVYIRMYPPGASPDESQISIFRSTSDDFLRWSKPELVLAPEREGLDFKGFAALIYEHYYVAWLWVWKGRESHFELAASRDGLEWQRIFPGTVAFPLGAPGTWDSAMVSLNTPIVRDGLIWIYYGAWNHPYRREAMERVQQDWIEAGNRMQRAIGLATLRLDGFVSLSATGSPGRVTTKTFRLPGGSLFVNADVRGELRAEFLDSEGRVLAGYSAEDCVPIRTDGIRQMIRWDLSFQLDSLQGRAVRLRFHMREADLYAFWFQPHAGMGRRHSCRRLERLEWAHLNRQESIFKNANCDCYRNVYDIGNRVSYNKLRKNK